MTQFYIGTKIVEAWPESKDGQEGYAVKYADGYVSWSPKEVFENAYLAMGLDSTKIVPQIVEDFIDGFEVHTFAPKTTVVKATLVNGYTITESSSCVDPANYDERLGQEICIKRIKDKIWELLGFMLTWSGNLYQAYQGQNMGVAGFHAPNCQDWSQIFQERSRAMKALNYIAICFSVLAIIGGIGCASLSHYVTPASIDQRAIDYAAKAKIVEPNAFSGYANLDKAIKLENAVGDAHTKNQLELMQLIDKDRLDYTQLNNITSSNRQVAQVREEQLFGPEGLLTMGLSMAGFGTLTGLIGLMRKRPQDITPDELTQLIAGKDAELTDKEKQFVELVKGIQNFINVSPTNSEILKTELAKVQSSDTKTEVAKVKATI